jgi:peroxiredoxin Q/BCP
MGREYMGVTRSSFLVNEKGKIFKIYAKVKPKGHALQVLEDFKE